MFTWVTVAVLAAYVIYRYDDDDDEYDGEYDHEVDHEDHEDHEVDHEDDDGDKYTVRVWTGDAWKCPSGYTDTGDGGDKQCRKKETDKKKARFMRKARRAAVKKCGDKPQTDDACPVVKCKKDGGWYCVGGTDSGMPYVMRKFAHSLMGS